MDYLDSLAVANWFIDTARASGEYITAMKLQKLIYFAHGWYLALYDKPLVKEQVEAWQWGPVFPGIYNVAKQYGSSPIDSHLFSVFGDCRLINKDDTRIQFLERIWNVYGKYTASQLSRMTHEPNGPWDKTVKQYPGRKNVDIDEKLIKESFKFKIENSN
jgi:uncharacterized phage-associated protein